MAVEKKQVKKEKTKLGKQSETYQKSGKSKQELAKKISLARKEVPVKKSILKLEQFQQVQKFFRAVYSELKKVHWPNRREIAVYTIVVLVAVAIIAVLIWLFDSLLSQVLRFIIK